jgi:hypothetical protein
LVAEKSENVRLEVFSAQYWRLLDIGSVLFGLQLLVQLGVDRCIELLPAQSLQIICKVSLARESESHWLGVRHRSPLAEESPIYFDPQALTQVLLLTSRYLVVPVQVGLHLKLFPVAVPVILAIVESLCRTPKLLLVFNTILRSLEGASNSLGWVKLTWNLLIRPNDVSV